MTSKKQLSEQDIRSKYITPAITGAGWDLHSQIREEYSFTHGPILLRGGKVKRGRIRKADYVLYYQPNILIAVVEAKDNNHPVGGGMQQALAYADNEGGLAAPFVFSSNGDAFLFHDKTATGGPIEREIPLDQFPSPAELWQRYCQWKGIDTAAESIVTQEFHSDGTQKAPRYYQLNAINRTVEAVATGQKRILLVMATGTGKTYTAFQIIWRLWKAKKAKRILFLADRNILVDQTMVQDFKPFSGAMAKLSTKSKTIERSSGEKVDIPIAMNSKRRVNASYEIYLGLYQAITGPEESKKHYRQFSPEFFDLIVIDECHRGSAAEDSQWREILEYFDSAIQVGMTATPKETTYVSNISYFGEPVYTYSLKQGIEDGFLAPYRVVRVDIDKDLTGWRPEEGKTDKHGKLIEDRIYNQKDFDKTLVIDQRTALVAQKVTEFLKGTDRYAKTIVFCEDTEHAERMRQALANANADLAAEKRQYVMRITGDDSEGKAQLDNFIDPESRYPVIATTSKLLTTGVDAKTCKLIVIDQRIQSMTEFKQIIGRGTRINEDYDKLFFTIMDFRKATELFADPDFDGPPICIYEPKEGEEVIPPDDLAGDDPDNPTVPNPFDPDQPDIPADDSAGAGITTPTKKNKREKFHVNDVEVSVVAERVQYFDPESGKLITESIRDYTKKQVLQEYTSLDDFVQHWTAAEKKQAIIEELEAQGIFLDALADDVGKDFDPFDLVRHVAFDQPPLTRRERAENVRKQNYFTKYGEQARAVLNALLDKYADAGVTNIEDLSVLRVDPFSKLGSLAEIIQWFGSKDNYLNAVRELEARLYSVSK